MQKRKQVVACFFGDGATSEGAFHEGVNMAAIWLLPVIYVCENNLYGASTHVSKVTRLPNIADRAAGYGIPGRTIDGNDVLAVYEAARQAAEQCRQGRGPILLELLTYRITGHSRRDPCHYQPAEEKQQWLRREPVKLLGERLVQRNDVEEQDLEQIRTKAERRINDAVEAARNEPEPTVDDLTKDVFV